LIKELAVHLRILVGSIYREAQNQLNSKLQIPNYKQYQNSNVQNSKL